ncbi:hypothetical protein [Leptolyngbya ohadii]|uniref:hypothetical protein n=1 Tax=Leptolyngbya ohadii TaxID=1962290 RepID=UPI000B5993DB|nr:hypothetical protein [Leptolyngbya ohadii]
MLHHVSMAVGNPEKVAQVLAEIWQGRYFPFPPCPGGFIVVKGDDYGTAIEVSPAGTELIPGADEAEFTPTEKGLHYTAFHAAISVPSSQTDIEAIAAREGWFVRFCDRGPFQLIELWVENKVLLELLPPTIAPSYLNFVTIENFEAFLAAEAPELAIAR